MDDKRRVTVIFEESRGMPGWWTVHSPDLPEVVTQGEGIAGAAEMFADAYRAMHGEAESGSGGGAG